MQDASSQDTFSELLGNSILHGPQDQPIRVETLWRTNQALFGVTQKGHFNLKTTAEAQSVRDKRPSRIETVHPLNYVNPHGRLRGNGFTDFVNSPLVVGASYYPELDETTTFIHAKVPAVQWPTLM